MLHQKKGFFTEVSLADVCPTGSSNNELRILADLLHIRTHMVSVSALKTSICLGRNPKNGIPGESFHPLSFSG